MLVLPGPLAFSVSSLIRLLHGVTTQADVHAAKIAATIAEEVNILGDERTSLADLNTLCLSVTATNTARVMSPCNSGKHGAHLDQIRAAAIKSEQQPERPWLVTVACPWTENRCETLTMSLLRC